MTRAANHQPAKPATTDAKSIPAMGLFGRHGAASVVSGELPRSKPNTKASTRANRGGFSLTKMGQRAA